MKTIFGMATVADLEALHTTVGELHQRQEIVTHSLDRQLTYFRLEDTAQVDHNMLTN